MSLRRARGWRSTRLAAGVGSAAFVGAALVAAYAGAPATSLADLRKDFARPSSLPVPSDNPLTPAKVSLGERLFNEPRLSADNSISCSSCHNPALAFTDGVARGKGVTRRPLARHTPSLWNLAWAKAFFWDGRATSLETQMRGPIEHPDEMAQSLEGGVEKLKSDADYPQAFAEAFPEDPRITPGTVGKALASYERTLMSPPTRFDRWVAGDAEALSQDEIAGFRLFTGKAGCANCHSGWAFTDNGFHDIGLPGNDLGRGPIIGLPAVNHAFKTPSLRELTWTAPYMHDGSLATLDDVIEHYVSGGVRRPTRSPDLVTGLKLDEAERSQLVAFLESLSSERPPRPFAGIEALAAAKPPPEPPPVATAVVSQRNKQFTPGSINLEHGHSLSVVNDDRRPHNVRIFDPRMTFNSGLQEPGETVSVPFAEPGTFEVFCGIHPNMRLKVEVR
jgi:cytochrome c peroxidase